MESTRHPVSVILPVRQEAGNLARCLGAIPWAGEIWVVDSGSTDGTAATAAALGARVVQFEYRPPWPKKKNWALENLPLAHEWVLLLDADEVLPPEAGPEIGAIVSDPRHPLDGYWINRRFQFLGRWLRHAYYPNWNLRLFRHRLGRFERLAGAETDSGDVEIHEHVVVRGRTGRLRAEMDHYAFPTVAAFVEKHNRYSNWEARVAMEEAGGDALQLREVGWRRRLRRWSRHLPARPLLRFAYVYFWQRGFLDGVAGFHFARLHAAYEAMIVAKEFELRSHRRP